MILDLALLLGVALPLSLFIPIVFFGTIIATIERWKFIDGMYVGGNLVLVPLSAFAPATAEGRIVDFFISCSSLGIFAWLIALQGAMPICAHTTAVLKQFLEKYTALPQDTMRSHLVALLLFLFAIVPLVAFLSSLPLGGILQLPRVGHLLIPWST